MKPLENSVRFGYVSRTHKHQALKPREARPKVFLLLFLQKKRRLSFFSEEKNQKTFIPLPGSPSC
jgi:hypothetical protein